MSAGVAADFCARIRTRVASMRGSFGRGHGVFHGRPHVASACSVRAMRAEIKHSPSFALAHLELSGGEQVRVEAGAMAAHSPGLELDAKMQGGLMKSIRRSVLGGESLFVSTYTAPAGGGWIDVAPRLPGDVFTTEVSGAYVLTRGSFLASGAGLEVDTKWGGFGNLVG